MMRAHRLKLTACRPLPTRAARRARERRERPLMVYDPATGSVKPLLPGPLRPGCWGWQVDGPPVLYGQ